MARADNAAADASSPLLHRRPQIEMGLIDSLRRYPPAVFFILGNELCERFSYYGMRAILVAYLISEHSFAKHTATLFYHLFACIAYLTPLVGSTLADSFFGRFNIILWVSIFYVLGHVLLSFGAIPMLSAGTRLFFDMGGLLVIAVSTGGIKPCVSAFAADQFEEKDADLRGQFFSFFYFAINAGSLMAFVLTPSLRTGISCFGKDDCYPLAFGVPGILMFLALVLFLLGASRYKKIPPGKENIAGMVVRCVGTAIARKNYKGSEKPKCGETEHWLDRAAPDFSKAEIASVKSCLNVSLIFLPIVFFWALFDQMGSTWIIQAKQMNGQIGSMRILPEHIHIINPLLILITVPIFEGVVYPLVRRVINLTPLRKMATGGLLTAFSFLMAAFLQYRINSQMEPLPQPGNAWVQSFDYAVPFKLRNVETGVEYDIHEKTQLPKSALTAVFGDAKLDVDLNDSNAGALFAVNDASEPIYSGYSLDAMEGVAQLRIVVLARQLLGSHFYVFDEAGAQMHDVPLANNTEDVVLKHGFFQSPDYTFAYGSNCSGLRDCPHVVKFYGQMGSLHAIGLDGKDSPLLQLVRGNEISILWMIPQSIVITISEVLVSVTGLEFAYSQASPTMKSMLQALWQLTVFAGNVIDMLISGTHMISNPAWEFVLYAALMTFVMIIFIVLAIRYKYVDGSALAFEKHHHDDLPLDAPSSSKPQSA